MLSVIHFPGYAGNKARQSGFTLLEILVAIVVLSIGLLGLAGLMATSMRNNHSAYQRTQATWLAYDVIDRMRVNRAAALTESYDIPLATATSPSAGLAKLDIDDWKTTLERTLPAGDGSVDVTPGTRAVTVIIQWNDTRGTGGDAADSRIGNRTQQFRVDTQL